MCRGSRMPRSRKTRTTDQPYSWTHSRNFGGRRSTTSASLLRSCALGLIGTAFCAIRLSPASRVAPKNPPAASPPAPAARRAAPGRWRSGRRGARGWWGWSRRRRSCGLRCQDRAADQFRDLRDDRVAEPFKAVHPSGNPMSHSTHVGFSDPRMPRLAKQSCKFQRPSFSYRWAWPLLLWLSRACGVGHDPDAVSPMRGTNGARRYAMPFRVIPDLGQASENAAHSPPKQRCHVLHNRVGWSNHANGSNHSPPEPRAGAGKSGAQAGVGDVLAGEPTSNDISLSLIELRNENVIATPDAGPMLSEDGARKRFDLTERDGLEAARAFQPEAETANAGKEVEHGQHHHANSLCPSRSSGSPASGRVSSSGGATVGGPGGSLPRW